MNTSINQFRGIVAITGLHDAGKSVLSLSNLYQPQEILLINDDLKIPPDLPFFDMVDLNEDCAGMSTKERYDYTLDIIGAAEAEDIPPRVIVWDTWHQTGALCREVVDKFPGLFVKNLSSNTIIRTGEISREGRRLETEILQRLKSMADIVILTLDTKPAYVNNVRIPDKSIPVCTEVVHKNTDLFLWLIPNPTDEDAPVGLTLKNIKKMVVTDTGINPVKILPSRIDPCTWQKINQYYDDPVGARDEISPSETPDEMEYSIITGTLTDLQKRAWLNGLKAKEGDGDLLNIEDLPDIKSIVAEHNISGVPPIMLKLINEVLEAEGQDTIDMGQMNRGLK